MPIHEMTDAEREQMLDALFIKLKIERWHPSRDELEQEVIDYLKKSHPCSLATCSRDNGPRVSVVDYVNDGLTLYFFSEGGGKFKNISEDDRVAVGIGTSARTITSVRGLNIWGKADVFTDETDEYQQAIELFRPLIEDFEQRTDEPVQFPPGMMRIIRVRPHRMVYFHYRKGIAHVVWEKEGEVAENC